MEENLIDFTIFTIISNKLVRFKKSKNKDWNALTYHVEILRLRRIFCGNDQSPDISSEISMFFSSFKVLPTFRTKTIKLFTDEKNYKYEKILSIMVWL